MEKEVFENLVSQTTKELPKEFLKKLKNVAILIQEMPDEYQLKQGGYSENKCLLGLYEGVPQAQRGYYNRALPDKITLFQKNIESVAGYDPETIKAIVKNTLWHEIGHHFGFTDEELNKLKTQKNNKN